MTAPRGTLSAVTEAWLNATPETSAMIALPLGIVAGPNPPAGSALESELAGGSIPIVIGLDPSLTATGVASSAGWCETRGYIKARAKDPGITQLPHAERYDAMKKLSWDIVDLVGYPDLIVIEAPAFSRTGGGAHERSYLWWSLYGAFKLRQIPVAVMSIQQRLTYATGKGSGGKGAVIDAASRRWPMFATGGNDNLSDAAVFCAAGMDHLGHPLAVVPASHRKALDAVAWPLIGGTS